MRKSSKGCGVRAGSEGKSALFSKASIEAINYFRFKEHASGLTVIHVIAVRCIRLNHNAASILLVSGEDLLQKRNVAVIVEIEIGGDADDCYGDIFQGLHHAFDCTLR